MEHSKVRSVNTQLKDRVLWFDGESTVSEDEIIKRFSTSQSTKGLYVASITKIIREYNRTSQFKVKVKETLNPLLLQTTGLWGLPDPIKTIDIASYVEELLINECMSNGWLNENSIKPEGIKRFKRVRSELLLYKSQNLDDFLRALIFVINTLEDKNVVWGVGRGSSVSSYVLYLIGVHDVDSIAYDLDITDFLH